MKFKLVEKFEEELEEERKKDLELEEKLEDKYIDRRRINKRGKIEVTEKEWDYLWNKKLGDVNKKVTATPEENKEWFKKVKEFQDKYECV